MTACVECGCFKARPGANTCKMCNDPITVQRRRSGIKARARYLTRRRLFRGLSAKPARSRDAKPTASPRADWKSRPNKAAATGAAT